MPKKLTIDQLIMLERLMGREYTLQGQPRKRPRFVEENDRLGIPDEHRNWIVNKRLEGIKSPALKQLLRDAHQRFKIF